MEWFGIAWFGIAWSDFLGPLFVIGLMGMILYFIMSSEAISQGRRQHPFPPTERDLVATKRLWRWRLRRLWPQRPA
jgi:hypothetical protein